MQDEQLRMYRHYSYDDPHLVAYWKLNETYTETDISYTINDYSQYKNQLSYSILAEPEYPQFVYDNTIGLSLCTFHDVATCLSVDYSDTTPMVMTAKRLTQSPTFQLKDFSYTKQEGDQIWYIENNTDCSSIKDRSQIMAYMTYKAGFINNFVIADSAKSPIDLLASTHYEVCYYISSSAINASFNLYQVYLMGLPLTVDPSSRTAFITPGIFRTWMTSGGDQGYGDYIQFSDDCKYPESDDFMMMRS